MTLKEAKKILEKEGFFLIKVSKGFEFSKLPVWEKQEVVEAKRVVNENDFATAMGKNEWYDRQERLKKEYEKSTKAPGPGEEQPEDKKGIIYPTTFPKADFYYKHVLNEGNPALKEAASQFNDALLDEQAKKIAELTKDKELIKKATLSQLDDFIEIYNLLTKESQKTKRLGKEIAKLNSIIHDKNAVLADVAEELRLSKIREKNLTEVCQKYMKENEELREKLADNVVDKIDAQALKSAESALAYKEKVIAEKDEVIADLGKELKAQKALVSHISKIRDIAKIKINLREKQCKKLKEALEEKTKLVEMVRNASKEYCDYGVAANEFIKELASLYVLANNKGIINDEILERCKNYQTYGFPANCNRETKKEINDIARGKTKVVGVDIAEEGGDHSAIIAQCCKNIAISKEEVKIIERCTKNGTELHYSEKDGFTYTNIFGDEIPIICLRGMCQVFTDEEIKNMKK